MSATRTVRVAWLAVAACAAPQREAPTAAWIDDTSVLTAPGDGRDRAVVDDIIARARASHGAYDKLAELTTHIGHRIAGSVELEHAVVWATDTMTHAGLTNVHTEKVMVPHWVRGVEDGAIVTPIARPLTLIGLGGTVPTPAGGITAPLVVVHDFDGLAAHADRVAGAVVLYDAPMPPWNVERGAGYGEVMKYRVEGAVAAAKLGAVAVLVRSLTEHSLRTPHTGVVRYDDHVAKLPAAAVTLEDADLLAQLAAHGPVRVHLHLESQHLPDAESANVIGEVRGTERSEEVVILGAHLDSWDVGQGAHDDGAGVVTMLEAAEVLEHAAPRRTVRVVLFTSEENGIRGGKAYAVTHADELGRTVAAFESDSGGFTPRGFGIAHAVPAAAERVRARVADLARPLHGLGATRFKVGGAGSDIEPMRAANVPLLGLDVDNRTYFDIHHTEADTLDKVDPGQLAADVAAVAALAYQIANLPGRLDDR